MKHASGAAVDRAYQDGATALFVACQNGDEPAVRLLLDACAAAVHQARAADGMTPLLVACQKGHAPVVELLLDRLGDEVGLPAEQAEPEPVQGIDVFVAVEIPQSSTG